MRATGFERLGGWKQGRRSTAEAKRLALLQFCSFAVLQFCSFNFGERPWPPRWWPRKDQFWCMTLATSLVVAGGSTLENAPGCLAGGLARINFGD